MVSASGRDGRPSKSRGRRARQAAWLVLVVTQERVGHIKREWPDEAVCDMDRASERESQREVRERERESERQAVRESVREAVWRHE